MFPKLDELERKLSNLEQKLSDSALIANQREYKKVAQEHAQVTKLAALSRKFQKVKDELLESQKMLQEEEDPDLLEIPARTTDESRFLVIGKIMKTHWSGIITDRGEATRIISVRRSRKEEVEL